MELDDVWIRAWARMLALATVELGVILTVCDQEAEATEPVADPAPAPNGIGTIEALFRRRLEEVRAAIPASEDRHSRPRALATYDAYFRAFPSAEADLPLRYQFAELLVYLKEYARAYEEYVFVRDADTKGRLALDAAKGAVGAAGALVRREPASPAWREKERAAAEALAHLEAGQRKLSVTSRT